MVYGELDRFPLDINIKIRMISFYQRLMKDENKQYFDTLLASK